LFKVQSGEVFRGIYSTAIARKARVALRVVSSAAGIICPVFHTLKAKIATTRAGRYRQIFLMADFVV
jgi:hypothetical protein